MEYASTNAGTRLEIKLRGEFTFADNEQFQKMAKGILDATSKEIVLDFSGLSFIDSAALSMLLVMRESCNKSRKKLLIQNSKGRVKEVLEEMKFSKFVRTQH